MSNPERKLANLSIGELATVFPIKAIKPEFGSQCTGCGLCCLAEQCSLSVSIFGEHPRCPALRDDGDRYSCSLIVDPASVMPEGPMKDVASSSDWGWQALGEYFGEMLGAGLGCDSGE